MDLAQVEEALDELGAGEELLEADFFERDLSFRGVDLVDQICRVFRFWSGEATGREVRLSDVGNKSLALIEGAVVDRRSELDRVVFFLQLVLVRPRLRSAGAS